MEVETATITDSIIGKNDFHTVAGNEARQANESFGA